MLGWSAVQNANWEYHFHAYGIADDTPEKLHNLTSENAALRSAAISHLNYSVFHQGTIYSVTPVVVCVVAGLHELDLRQAHDNESWLT